MVPTPDLDDVKNKFLPYRDSNSDLSVVQPISNSYIDCANVRIDKDSKVVEGKTIWTCPERNETKLNSVA
jgi:hypothetical protein